MVMGVLESWFFAKGVKLTESYIHDLAKELLEVSDSDSALQRSVDNINSKLDRLLNAPYEVALRHLREGSVEKSMDYLKIAMAQTPLNIPARLLHIKLLCRLKKFDLALDELWEFARSFSYRIDLIPPVIHEAYCQWLGSMQQIASKQRSISFRYGGRMEHRDYFVEEIWCSEVGLAIKWKRNHKFLFWKDAYSTTRVNAFAWDGTPLFDVSKGGPYIQMITGEYAIIGASRYPYCVFEMRNGTEVEFSFPKGADVGELFAPSGIDVCDMPLYRMSRFDRKALESGRCYFGNASFSSAIRVETEEDYFPTHLRGPDGGIIHVPYSIGVVECKRRSRRSRYPSSANRSRKT